MINIIMWINIYIKRTYNKIKIILHLRIIFSNRTIKKLKQIIDILFKIFNFALDVNSKDIFQDNVLKNINKKYKIVTFVYNHHIKPIYVNRFYVLNVEIYVIQQKIAKFNKKSNQKILKVFAKNAKNLDIHKMNVLLFKLNHFKKIKKI